jgi:hypothetical protein
MITTADELQSIVDEFVPQLLSISQVDFTARPKPGKWSKLEVLGHLIDSSQTNIRRFITSQYELAPPRVRYDQEFWVSINNYQDMKKEDVINLWRLMNERICAVCRNTPRERYEKKSDTGSTATDLKTIEWLAADYVKHLKHHLNQIFAGAFDVVYP